MRQVFCTNSVPADFTGAYTRALAERGAAANIEGPDLHDPTLMAVGAAFLRPDSSLAQQQWVGEQCRAALQDAAVPRHRNASSGVGIFDFHADARYIDVIDNVTGLAIGVKITAHDQESAEAGGRKAAEALGLPPDAVTALWSTRDA